MTNVSKRQNLEEMNRAARRRLEKQESGFWQKTMTRLEVAQAVDNFDTAAVAPCRDMVDVILEWLALPTWKRAWLRLRGRHPFKASDDTDAG